MSRAGQFLWWSRKAFIWGGTALGLGLALHGGGGWAVAAGFVAWRLGYDLGMEDLAELRQAVHRIGLKVGPIPVEMDG